MYMDTTTIVITTIALGASLIMMFILAYANAILLQENRFLKQRLRAWRKSCQNHVEVPF
jgi:invasion protein IalB